MIIMALFARERERTIKESQEKDSLSMLYPVSLYFSRRFMHTLLFLFMSCFPLNFVPLDKTERKEKKRQKKTVTNDL